MKRVKESKIALLPEAGNLTNDGYRAYSWDEENRLIAIETSLGSVATGIKRRRSEYLYDAQWRRIFKTDYAAWDGSAFVETNVTRFVWDGWNLFAEIISNQQSPTTTSGASISRKPSKAPAASVACWLSPRVARASRLRLISLCATATAT